MGDDSLDALLKTQSSRRQSRPPGLKVADILTMPPEQQSLVNWLMRQYEALPQNIAQHLGQPLETVQQHLEALTQQGLLKTIHKQGGTYYRVKLAPRTGRQMPTDVWKVLDANTQQANVFISYSRRNKEFVQQLYAALKATGREVWVDWENIPVAVDWWQEIQLGIELADTFVFVLSPDSVASKVCGQEIEEALKHNKRLVPIVHQDIRPDQVHPELARLNWIFLRPDDNFEQGFKNLLEALDQDLDYVRTHTRLLVRALEWDRSDRDSSYLLRGADLERANHYLAQGKAQEPRPTALHHQYVLASAEAEATQREKELQQQRQLVAGQQRWLQLVSAISILAAALGLTSFGLSRQAQHAQQLAEQAQLKALTQSSAALFVSNQRFEALLAATQAGHLFQTLEPQQQTADLQSQVMSSLQQALFWVQERNRLEGHTGNVWQLAFSPQTETLASVSADGSLRLWQLDGEEVNRLEGNGAPLLDLDFAVTGDHIAVGDAEGTLYLWAAAEAAPDAWRLQAQWAAHDQSLRAVDFSPDAQLIASASADATVKIWTRSGELVRTLAGDLQGLRSLLWMPNNRIVAGDEQGRIFIWDAATGERLVTFTEHTGAVTALDVGPTGQRLVSTGSDRQVKVYDLDTNIVEQTWTAHAGTVYNVQFMPDGQRLVTVGDDKLVRLWQIDGTPSETLVGHTGLVSALAISSDGGMIATSGGDRAVRLWKLARNNLDVLRGHQGPVNTIALSPAGQQLASGGEDGILRLWDLQGRLQRSLAGHSSPIQAIAYYPTNATQLISASRDGTVQIWPDLTAATPRPRSLVGHTGAVYDVAYHPNGDLIATAGADRTVRLWQADGTLLTTLDAHQEGVLSVDFSPDGRYLASGGWDHRIKLWSVDSLDSISPRIFTGHQGWILDVQFSPDSRYLASASYDNTVRLWDVNTGEMTRTLSGHRDGVLAVSFGPNGQQLITASNDNTLRIWTLEGTPLATLSGHTQGVTDVVVGPAGQFAASASRDSRVLIWKRENMDSIDALLRSSCDWLADYLTHTQPADETLQERCRAYFPTAPKETTPEVA